MGAASRHREPNHHLRKADVTDKQDKTDQPASEEALALVPLDQGEEKADTNEAIEAQEETPSESEPANAQKAGKDSHAADAEATDPNGVKSDGTGEAAKPKKPLIMMILLVLVLLFNLGILAAGVFLYKNLTSGQQSSSERLAVLESQLLDSKKTVSHQAERVQAQASQVVAIAERLNVAEQQLSHNTDLLAKLPGAERQDWMLAEAEYLLRLANQRLQLEQDSRGALAMLEAADAVLVETGNPYYNPVRADIAAEILALASVPATDVTGAIKRLQALQDALSKFDWVPTQRFVAAEASAETVGSALSADGEAALAEPTPWYQHLYQEMLEGVGKVIRIRQHDMPLDAPVSPDQLYYLQQNSRLMLEQAQVALLRQEQALYQRSLARVQDWLNQYLVNDSAESKAVRQSLAQLASWDVAPVAPDISGSLMRLQRLLEEHRRGQFLPQTPAPEPDQNLNGLPSVERAETDGARQENSL
jgi:uroporphyrin-3 C-methyltransferase